MTYQATVTIKTLSITAASTAKGYMFMQRSAPFYGRPTWSLNDAVALALTFILAVASVMYTCYWAGHTEGVRDGGGFLTEFPYTLTGFHIVISFSLAVSAVGLWLGRVRGLIISTLALVSVLVAYGYWYFQTLNYLSELRNNLELYRRVQQEVGWFHGATKWDFVVLALVAILLSWHLLTLVKVARGRNSTSASA
jgi:hypothetical protein